MILIGLTGGIASGKSTVSKIFAEKGVPVIDADYIARLVVEPGKRGWWRVRKHFGDDVLNEDRSVNREKLAELIFNDHKKRKLLNKCLHGLIAWEMIKQIISAFLKGYRFIILDIPLLFETGLGVRFLTYTVVVDCKSETKQVARFLVRHPELTRQHAELRIKSQMTSSERSKLADYVVDNSGDLASTKKQVNELYTIFSSSRLYLRLRIFTGIFILSGIIISRLI